MFIYILTGVIAAQPSGPVIIPPDIVAGPFQATQTKLKTKATSTVTASGVVMGTKIQ